MAATPTTADPLALLYGLALESGEAWGDIATAQQRTDAKAMLRTDPGEPRMHFLTRPRGGSKTTDTGGICIASLLAQAPPRSTSHAFARDRDQAGRLVLLIGGLVARSGLGGLLEVASWSVTNRATGARLVVESADVGSAYGAIPYLVVTDELAQWPDTRGSRALWEGLISGLPKRRDSRLITITTAGDPAHWSAEVIAGARPSPRWRVSEMPGPLPWVGADDLTEQRRMLPESSYRRLHLNQWTAAEDRLVRPEDLDACARAGGSLPPDRRHSYVIGLDLGLKDDRTVLTVCHAEQPPQPTPGTDRAAGLARSAPLIVLDRIETLHGSRSAPVQLADIEQLAYDIATDYGHAPIRLDPWQAVGLAQRLRARGVRVTEWNFSAQSVGLLASNLHVLLREHRMALPEDPELRDELLHVRLRETRLGVYRLDHDSGRHDDRAVSLGLAALALTERPPPGRAHISDPGKLFGPIDRPIMPRQRSALPTAHALRQQMRRQPRGLRAIIMPGSANDPGRVRG